MNYYIKDKKTRNYVRLSGSDNSDFSMVWCGGHASKWDIRKDAEEALKKLAGVHGDFVLERYEVV